MASLERAPKRADTSYDLLFKIAKSVSEGSSGGGGGGGGGGVSSWNDLTDKPSAFDPTAHASSHAAAGSDPITVAQSQVTSLTSDLALKAPLDSAALTGTPTAPTASGGTNTTQIATTAFVQALVASSVAGLLDLKGSLDASANPNYSAASRGDTYYVTVAGKVGGASGKSVDIGDAVIASADNAGGTEASVGTSWFVLEHNLAGVLLSANNLSDLANAATARTNLGLGDAATKNTGTTAGTVAAGNDSRFTDSRTPTTHASSHAPGGSDAVASLFSTRSAKTGAYTVVAGDRGVLIDATSGTWSLSLTAAATLGSGFSFGVFNSGSGVITVDPDASETIRDATSSATTKTLAQGEGGILICGGTGWLFLKVAAGGIGGSTGSTDNRLLRADGTGGATLQNSSLSTEDVTTYSGKSRVEIKVDDGSTSNLDLVTRTKGTGAWYLGPPADGTATGGNNRGDEATDFQRSHFDATSVASGLRTLAGGYHARPTGTYAVTWGYSVSAADYGVCFGIAGSQAGYGLTFGSGCTGSAYSLTGGYNVTTSGSAASGLGNSVTVAGDEAFATGREVSAPLKGQVARGSGKFTTSGDAQFSGVVSRIATTNATPTEMFLDGSGATKRLLVPANGTMSIVFETVARTSTAAGTIESATFTRKVLVTRGSAANTTTIVSQNTVGTDIASAGAGAWAITFSADTTNGAVKQEATGAAATNIYWVTNAHITQVIYA